MARQGSSALLGAGQHGGSTPGGRTGPHVLGVPPATAESQRLGSRPRGGDFGLLPNSPLKMHLHQLETMVYRYSYNGATPRAGRPEIPHFPHISFTGAAA